MGYSPGGQRELGTTEQLNTLPGERASWSLPSPGWWLVWVLVGGRAQPGWHFAAGTSERASVFKSLGLVREPNSSAKFYYDSEKSGSVLVWGRKGMSDHSSPRQVSSSEHSIRT